MGEDDREYTTGHLSPSVDAATCTVAAMKCAVRDILAHAALASTERIAPSPYYSMIDLSPLSVPMLVT